MHKILESVDPRPDLHVARAKCQKDKRKSRYHIEKCPGLGQPVMEEHKHCNNQVVGSKINYFDCF
jgi:hypothetical protein